MCLAFPVWADVTVTVEELGTGGDIPALECAAGAAFREHPGIQTSLIVFGGSKVSGDFPTAQVLYWILEETPGPAGWEERPDPGLGPACGHTLTGNGDAAYLIGGYAGDWSHARPMDSTWKVALDNLELQATQIDIQCTNCPVERVDHSAGWVEDGNGPCDGGGVYFNGGMTINGGRLDDAWMYCPSSKEYIEMAKLPYAAFGHSVVVLGREAYTLAYNVDQSEPTMDVIRCNLVSDNCEIVEASGWAPPSRRGGRAVVFASGKIMYLGGIYPPNAEVLDQILLADFTADLSWVVADATLPKPLAHFVKFEIPEDYKIDDDSDAVIVFGGITDYFPRTLSNSTYLITVTDNGPSADYAVPAVAQVQGAGAFFTSVMHLYNDGATDLGLEMTFTPRDGSGGEVTTVSHTVPAGVMQTINAPLATLFGFGGGQGRVGSVLITVTSGLAADLMVQTVVFAQLDTGEEYGQFFPAMGAGDAVGAGQTVYLNTTEDPAHNRVNIGLMAVADGTRFQVTPVDPIGNGLAAAETYDLDTGGNTQINNIHTSFGLGTMADVVVQVEVVTGSGLAYASVLDGSGSYSGTSDPTTILPVSGGSEKVTLLEIGSIQGLNEFSGSASITNYSGRTAAVRADFFQRDDPGVMTSQNLSIPAGETLGYSDLGADLFGVSGDVGTVVLTTTNGTGIGATGREFAIFRGHQGDVVGTAGQLIAGQTDDDRLDAGTTHYFIGLRQDSGGGGVERSHIAVFNPATTDAQVVVRLYDGGNGAFEGERSWTVPSLTLIQVNNVIRQINSNHDAEEKRIEVEVNRRVFMNAFRVNGWGDPVTLSPFPG